MVAYALVSTWTACLDPQASNNVGQGAEGGVCASAEGCQIGLVCAGDGICRVDDGPGTVSKGGSCGSTTWCRVPLACDHEGTCTDAGEAGTAPRDASCGTDGDCAANLLCVDDRCVGLDAPQWMADCPASDDDAFAVIQEAAPAHFSQAPRPGPWPAKDWPVPDVALELVGDITQDLQTTPMGPLGSLVFRTSAAIDAASLQVGFPGEGGTIAVVDVTPGIDWGRIVPVHLTLSHGVHPVACSDWLVISPAHGDVWTPGHRYAAMLFSGIASKDGDTPTPSATTVAMLSPGAPADEGLKKAWWLHADARDWLDTQGIVSFDVAGITTFVAADASSRMAGLAGFLDGLPDPVTTGVVACAPPDPGPFADPADPTRGCADVPTGVDEWQGVFAAPRWRDGSPPWRAASDGGRITWIDDLPVQTGDDAVTFSLSVPNAAPQPVDGWPVVVVVGESGYRTAAAQGLVERWAAEALTGGPAVAVLGIDLPHQGPRRAPVADAWSDAWPLAGTTDALVHNGLHPAGWRDGQFQAASDLLWAVRLAESLADGDDLPGADLLLDPTRIAVVSQGWAGLGAVPGALWSEDVDVIAVSTGLATWRAWGVARRTPTDGLHDLRSLLGVALVWPNDPATSLMQRAVESVDNAVHGNAFAQGRTPRHHVLLALSPDDPLAPVDGQVALARAVDAEVARFDVAPLDGLVDLTAPVVGNRDGWTVVAAAYGAGDDPHLPWTSRTDAPDHLSDFLASWLRDGVPTWDP